VKGFVVCKHDKKVKAKNSTGTKQFFVYLTRHHLDKIKEIENEEEKDSILKKGKDGISKEKKRKQEHHDIRSMFQPKKKIKLTKVQVTKKLPFVVTGPDDENAIKEFSTQTLLDNHINSNYGKYSDVEKPSFVQFIQDFVDIGAAHGHLNIDDYLVSRKSLKEKNDKNFEKKFQEKKKAIQAAAKQKELHIELDLWKNEATQEHFIGMNGLYWKNDWKEKKWIWTCTALGMEQLDSTLNLGSSEAVAQAHTAENLLKLVKKILNFWGIKELVNTYSFKATSDNGADITAAMELMGWKNVGACHVYQTTLKHAWKKAVDEDAIIDDADSAAKECSRLYKQGSLGARMKQADRPSLESESKTRWDAKFRMYDKITKNETFLRDDPDTAGILEDVPDGIFSEIAQELEFHLKNRKKLEERGPRLHMLLVILDRIETHIRKTEGTEHQKVLREAVANVLHLRRGPNTGRITCLGSIATNDHRMMTWMNPRWKKKSKTMMREQEYEEMKEEVVAEIVHILRSIGADEDDNGNDVDQEMQNEREDDYDSESEEEVEPLQLEERAEKIFDDYDAAKFKRSEFGKEQLDAWGDDPTSFFEQNKNRYPIISRLYRRKATIPLSEAEVERFFSLAKFLVEAKRYRMTARTLKVILMQNIWQKQENWELFRETVEENNTKISELEN